MARKNGFSLIEIVMAIGIVALIASFGTVVGIGFYEKESFSSEAYNLVGILRRARNESINNLRELNHGVYISSSSYVLFEGDSYASRTAAFDLAFPKSGGISASGPQEVIFETLSGNANPSGTIILEGAGKIRKIYINGEGRIDW